MTDDELPTPEDRLATPPLSPLGITELQGYIKELQAEIVRAETEIARKRSHLNAAEGVFRQS